MPNCRLKQRKRKYNFAHIVFYFFIVSSAWVCQAAERYRFELPAMAAAQALDKLAETSGYSLIYPFDDTIVVVSNPVVGTYTLEQALEKLLLNTPLSAFATDKRVIAVSSTLNNYNYNLENFAIDVFLKNQLKFQVDSILFGNDSIASPIADTGSLMVSEKAEENIIKAAETERIQIIGSRRINRSPSEALAPIDIINKHDLSMHGNSDIISTLANVIPSYNSNQEAISDVGTMIRPANLRGLPTDSTLILVNGKRRHRSGVIYEFISGLNVGAHGVDLEPIPSIALKSVEVLRDGAAAQYGSDAIAGVINFRLENSAEVNRVIVNTGKHYAGDGTKLELSGMLGSKLSNKGTANFSFQLSESEDTSRGVQDPAVLPLIESGINENEIQNPVVIWGAPEITNNIKLFGNVELDIGEANTYQQLYLFGNWAQRDIDGSFYYRNPNTRASVFTNPNDGTRLFFDMTSDNTGACPVPTIPGAEDDAIALAAVFANPNCFAFNERFPGGFTPRFGGRVTDSSLAIGIRGAVEQSEAELTYDVSLVVGKNRNDYKLANSVNASLGENSPTDFELGSQIETEGVFNADFTYPINLGFQSELNIAFGYQAHFEQFEIIAGDKASYEAGPFSQNSEAVGANGFPGFSPETASINHRVSNAIYLDVESDITERLSMSLAIRYEDIDKIGNTFDGKISARFQVDDKIAFRSTLSSAFRAPTVGQSTLQRLSTSNSIVNGVVVQQNSKLVSALSPIAVARSGGGLEPETAKSFSIGLLSEIGPVNVTFDYFNIKVDDRLSLFSSAVTAEDAALLLASGVKSNVSNIQYYANDFDSITQGVDIVASVPFDVFGGNNLLTLAYNYTDTELSGYNDKSPISMPNVRKERELGLPKNRAVLTYTHSQGKLNSMFRLNYYGSFYNAQFNDVSLLEKVAPIYIADLEFSYGITDNLVVALGAKNIFDTYPEEYSQGRRSGFLGAIYPLNSPTGFNGGYYYLRMEWDL